MSGEWITLIAGLTGTVLGVSIPSGIKILENHISYSNSKKEKYEPGIRLLLGEYVPEVNRFLSFIRAIAEVGYRETYDRKSQENYAIAIKLYESEIKDNIPIHVLLEVNELNDHLNYLLSFVDFILYPIEKGDFQEKFSLINLQLEVGKAKEKVDKIEKTIKRKHT